RAPTARAADAGHRHGLAELPVQIAKQSPRAAIAHAQLSGGLSERPAPPDRLEQGDLPRPERALRSQVDAQSHLHESLRPHATKLPPPGTGCTALRFQRSVMSTSTYRPELHPKHTETTLRKPVATLLSLVTLSLGALLAAPASGQELRIASAAANLNTNLLATFASMTTVSKVYRVCATGGN